MVDVRSMHLREKGEKEYVNQHLESTLESVDIAETVIMEAAEKAGFDEDDMHKIGMASRECMVNAVVHGNRYNVNKKVHLRVDGTEDHLTIRIADEGEGFDISSLPDPLAQENLLRHSGRGIFLIRAFMDEVDVRPSSPKGTEVILVKKKSVSESK
ncbi:MAG: ATP-binding protein [Acidobacteriota bacterium]|nr:ATP-binding protein [Acidobacteriota bacterium]